jgi:hypothetical protein
MLAQPVFAQGVERSFLEGEADISCYVNVGEEIDLAEAEPLYKVLEAETETYLIGTVELSGYGEEWWPHVWIHKDGWIVVYYPKDEPTSKLMHWHGYQGTITTTTLKESLFSIARQLGADMAKVEVGMRYYHWQYPDATRLLIVLDTGGTDSFRYMIPVQLPFMKLQLRIMEQWAMSTLLEQGTIGQQQILMASDSSQEERGHMF